MLCNFGSQIHICIKSPVLAGGLAQIMDLEKQQHQEFSSGFNERVKRGLC